MPHLEVNSTGSGKTTWGAPTGLISLTRTHSLASFTLGARKSHDRQLGGSGGPSLLRESDYSAALQSPRPMSARSPDLPVTSFPVARGRTCTRAPRKLQLLCWVRVQRCASCAALCVQDVRLLALQRVSFVALLSPSYSSQKRVVCVCVCVCVRLMSTSHARWRRAHLAPERAPTAD